MKAPIICLLFIAQITNAPPQTPNATTNDNATTSTNIPSSSSPATPSSIGQKVSITLSDGTVLEGNSVNLESDGIFLLTDTGGTKIPFPSLSKSDKIKFAAAYATKGRNEWRVDDAIADYSIAVQLNPNDATIYRDIGHAKMADQDWDGAINAYTKATALDPTLAPSNFYLYFNLGNAEAQKTNWVAAIAAFDKAIQIDAPDPNDKNSEVWAYADLGRAEDRNGNSLNAISDFTKAIAIEPDQETFYVWRGDSLTDKGDFTRAIVDYNKAISLNPSDDVAFDNKAVCESSLQNWDSAIADYSKAVGLNPKDDFGYRHRAAAELAKGDNVSANDDMARANQITGTPSTPDGGIGTPSPSAAASTTDVQSPSAVSQGTWIQVASFAGSSDKNTEPFTIHYDRWRVRWSSEATSEVTSLENKVPGLEEAVAFYATAVSDDTPEKDSQDIVSKQGPGSDSTELRGGGTWTLHVIASSSNWTAVIEEYAPTSP